METEHFSIVQEERATYYVSNKEATTITVRIDEDTLWLMQSQMVDLFETTKQNISLHISNIFKEGEFDKSPDVKYSLTTAKEQHFVIHSPLNFFKK